MTLAPTHFTWYLLFLSLLLLSLISSSSQSTGSLLRETTTSTPDEKAAASDPRQRAEYPRGIPGLQGHVMLQVPASVLPPDSPHHDSSPDAAPVSILYGGYSQFMRNYTSLYRTTQTESRLNDQVYIVHQGGAQLELLPFNANRSSEVLATLHNQKIPGGRAYFDHVLLKGHLLWISGGIKDLHDKKKEYSGIADSCLYGDVWIFNITSGFWRQLVDYRSERRETSNGIHDLDSYVECTIDKTHKVESAFDFVFLYTIIVACITLAVSCAFWITCAS